MPAFSIMMHLMCILCASCVNVMENASISIHAPFSHVHSKTYGTSLVFNNVVNVWFIFPEKDSRFNVVIWWIRKIYFTFKTWVSYIFGRSHFFLKYFRSTQLLYLTYDRTRKFNYLTMHKSKSGGSFLRLNFTAMRLYLAFICFKQTFLECTDTVQLSSNKSLNSKVMLMLH